MLPSRRIAKPKASGAWRRPASAATSWSGKEMTFTRDWGSGTIEEQEEQGEGEDAVDRAAQRAAAPCRLIVKTKATRIDISSTPSRPTTSAREPSASGSRPHQLGSIGARRSLPSGAPSEVERQRSDQESVGVVVYRVPVPHHVVQDRGEDEQCGPGDHTASSRRRLRSAILRTASSASTRGPPGPPVAGALGLCSARRARR